MADTAAKSSFVRLRGRSYMAFVLAPEPPVADWLTEIDNWIKSSAGFFVGRPVVLDLAGVSLSGAAVAHLITELGERGIRIMGLEGADPSQLVPGLPPLLKSGRPVRNVPEPPQPKAAPAPAGPEPGSLLIEQHVRSGQKIVFPAGDVTVLGSIGSGAEVIAGGSIHIYGTLRGRAMAGSNGNARARIFCGRLEAELLAIDGYYRTAEQIDPGLHSRAAQAWLDGNAMTVAALD